MKIQIDIIDKRARVVDSPVIVCGNSCYSVEFNFDEEWASATAKTARFAYIQNGQVKYQDVVFAGTTAEVPVLSNTGEVLVGVFAGDLQTTTPARIPCERSIRCGTGAPADPTPDQYDQIMELLSNAAPVELAAQVAENAQMISVLSNQIGGVGKQADALTRQVANNTESIGNIETALDAILAIQNELIGGDAV